MATIGLKGIVKSFGTYEAIREVSTELSDGQLTVIIGPSGSGKTTLLRSIAGLEGVDSGEITIAGKPVTHLDPKDRDVAFVFQNYALYPHMTVRDNIAFPLRSRGVRKDERRRRADEVGRRLGMGDLLDRKPAELSGGQQQRVAIGRAIIREPAVFLFDEPLSNLDAQLRIQMRQEILRLREELKVTAVWVTHDQEEAMAMGDEIIVFKEGTIAQQAPPDELYMRPANLYVANTIGSPAMNLFDGTLVDSEFRGPMKLGTAMASFTGEVVMGIRPEDIHLAAEVEGSRSTGSVSASVELIEPLGPRAIVSMKAGSAKLTGVFDRRSLRQIEGRDSIEISAYQDSLHFFDPDTEQRIEADDSADRPTDGQQ